MVRSLRLLFPLLVLSACVEEVPPPPSDDAPPSETPTEEVNDDEGNLSLFVSLPSYGHDEILVALGGLFVESRRGVFNLAQCIAFPETFCASELPTELDDYVLVDAFSEDVKNALRARNMGSSVRLGPYHAPPVSFDGLHVYWETFENLPGPGANWGLTIGPGAWGEELTLSDVIQVPAALYLRNPDPKLYHTFTPHDLVSIHWTAGGPGQPYLAVVTPGERRLYLLEDDGAFDLDLTELDLQDGDPVDISVSRWADAAVDVDGHELIVQVQFDHWLHGVWASLDGRVQLEPVPDTCGEAVESDAVQPGSYWGYLTDHGKNLNPGVGNGCTGLPAQGREAMLPLDVEPWESVEVAYRLPSDNASLYLLADCQATNSCVAGSDTLAVGARESVKWFNASDDPRRIYIVLDSSMSSSNVFELDITASGNSFGTFRDTCLEAINQGPLGAGTYAGDLSFHTNVLDPGATCGPPSPGADGLAQIHLEADQTLTATVNMPGRNPTLYLMYSCSALESCAAAADNASGSSETLSYTNLSGFAENLYLVVDAAGLSGSFIIDLHIE